MTSVRKWPVVLMYHGFVADEEADRGEVHDPLSLFVRVSSFAKQLDYLTRTGWSAVSLTQFIDIADGRRSAGRSFLLTIDDGYRSVFDLAAPVLARADVPAVLFVPPGLLSQPPLWIETGRTEKIVTLDELRELDQMGIDIGGHGWDHTSMVGLSDHELERHTSGVREKLGEVLGHPPRSFAYPFGDVSRRTLDAVRGAGYDVAFSVYRDDGRFCIARSDIKPADSLAALRLKLVPWYRDLWRAVGHMGPVRPTVRRAAQRLR